MYDGESVRVNVKHRSGKKNWLGHYHEFVECGVTRSNLLVIDRYTKHFFCVFRKEKKELLSDLIVRELVSVLKPSA